MRTVLNAIFSPYKYGNTDIDDSWVMRMHETIMKERNLRTLYHLRDEMDSKITFQVSGIIRERLLHLYEYAQYRINLFIQGGYGV